MLPPTLLQLINERHGTAFTLGERYVGGEQGAYALSDGAGGQFVLKWNPGANHLRRLDNARVVTDHLRGRGYPAPRSCYLGLAAGGAYVVQPALPGTPLMALTASLLPHLLALNDVQAGQALLVPNDWPAEVVTTVLTGGDGYCVLASLRTYSDATAELLAVLQRLVAAHADDDYATTDIVHFDFTPANILVADGQISGVIDWEGTCSGDRAFDLATLLFYAYEDANLRALLWQQAVARANPTVVSVYLAHLIVRQVDWSIRHHDRSTIDRWLRVAGMVLGDLTQPTKY